MTAVNSKAKTILPYIIFVILAAILTLAAQLGVLLSQEHHSRIHAFDMAAALVEKAAAYVADEELQEKLQFEMLAESVSESAAAAMEPKAQRLKDMELLTLVNPWNEVPEDYVPELEEITEGQSVDVRCADDLRHMVLDCFLAGGAPYICSSYRTNEMQEYLYNNKVQRVLAQGYSYEQAPAVAAQSVAVPGTSEHQLGLAVDIIDKYFTDLTYMQEYTYTQQWLIENSWKYGFILRYPNGTTDITGIIYEPWHYRYVGREVAAEVHEMGVTFEEYLPTRRGR